MIEQKRQENLETPHACCLYTAMAFTVFLFRSSVVWIACQFLPWEQLRAITFFHWIAIQVVLLMASAVWSEFK